jgi:hypothetical protein
MMKSGTLAFAFLGGSVLPGRKIFFPLESFWRGNS